MANLKLTEKSVAALRPATQHASSCPGGACACPLQSYHWDTELVGFGVVVGRTGIKTFIARAWVGKKKRRVKIGVAGSPRPDGHPWTVALARVEARQLLGRMSAGEDPNAGKRATSAPLPSTGPTLRQAMELHVTNMRAGRNRRRRVCAPRSIHKIETEIPHHLAAWLDRPLVDLTAFDLQNVCDRIVRETRPRAGAVNAPGRAQANKLIAHVSAIWNAADRLYDLGGRNPAKRLSPGALAPRTTRIDDGAFADWYAKVTAADMNPVRRDLQLVSLFTGIRSDGIRQLRWEDIDHERALVHVRKAKGDRPYSLPLVETVRAILARRRTENAVTFGPWGGDQGWCFPSLSREAPLRVIPVSEVKERRIDRSRADDEGRPVRVQHLPGIHANRRTFNSVAIEIGIPPEARLALMNHEGKGVNVKHYGVPQSWEFLRACAERIEVALRQRLGLAPIASSPPAERPVLRAV